MERILRSKLPRGEFISVAPSTSRLMKRIHARGNESTETRLRSLLVGCRIEGWVLHACFLPGCPDFYFNTMRLAVFVDGCFWHGCSRCGHIPSTRRSFWFEKIRRNRLRDRRINSQLNRKGVRVIRVWEHSLTSRECRRLVVDRIRNSLRPGQLDSRRLLTI